MNTLSRREEEVLLKTSKARALQECHDVVKDFADCASGRTVTVAWACRGQWNIVKDCMLQYTGPEPMEKIRAEYLKLRNNPTVVQLNPPS